jgi:hypothetical protein
MIIADDSSSTIRALRRAADEAWVMYPTLSGSALRS